MFNGSKTILIVEDDALIRMVAADELTKAGYDVIEAEDAADALQALQRQRVFLLFTDVNMPGEMDGLGLARLVRERWPDVRVIATSGGDPAVTDDWAGVELFLRKPYQVAGMLAAVERMARA